MRGLSKKGGEKMKKAKRLIAGVLLILSMIIMFSSVFADASGEKNINIVDCIMKLHTK